MRLIISIKNWLFKPQNFYITIALLAGLTLCFVLPPYRGPDEAAHVFRIHQLTSGDVFLEPGPEGYGHPIPDAIQRVNIKSFQDKEKGFFDKISNLYEAGKVLPSDQTSFQTFEGSGTYNPVAYINYLPTSVFARIVTNNAYVYFMILRIVGLLSCIALFYAAIRFLPIGKWFLVAIALLPMSLHQYSVVSTDGILLASTALFISLILYTRQNYKTVVINKRQRYFLFGSLFLLAAIISSKPGYIFILLAILALPLRLFSSVKKFVLFALSLLVAGGLIFGVWYIAVNTVGQTNAMTNYFERVNDTQLESKKKIIKNSITSPTSVPNYFINTYIVQARHTDDAGVTTPVNAQPTFIYQTFVGSFGSLNTHPPAFLLLTVPMTLLLALFLGKQGHKLVITRKLKQLAWLIIVGSFLFISIIFLFTWTPVGSSFIFGIQGRYFIPLLPMFLLLVPRTGLLRTKESIQINVLAGLITSNVLLMLVTVYYYFYA